MVPTFIGACVGFCLGFAWAQVNIMIWKPVVCRLIKKDKTGPWHIVQKLWLSGMATVALVFGMGLTYLLLSVFYVSTPVEPVIQSNMTAKPAVVSMDEMRENQETREEVQSHEPYEEAGASFESTIEAERRKIEERNGQ